MRFPIKTTLVSLIMAGSAIANGAMAANYEVSITNLTRGIHFTPLIAAAHDPSVRMFHAGTAASTELQAIAEGGDIMGMQALLNSVGASVAAGDGLVAPGQTVTLMLEGVSAAQVFSLSSMLLPTNDGFVGIDSAAFPSSGSVTLFARGYDAGTEANDELVGSGAPGMPGFPAPPPVVATGTGLGGSGINVSAEGYVHVHPGVLGDLDASGGVSDINAAVHRWQNPVARIKITKAGDDVGVDAPSAVENLSGTVYSSTSVELFWDRAHSSGVNVVSYTVSRNGSHVATTDGVSFFDEGLMAGTGYTYAVRAVDANGVQSAAEEVQLMTNAH